MKKHHPHPSANPEALYAQVNKQNRKEQRHPTPEDEVVYASVSSRSPHSRGKHHPQRQQESETDYTEVAPPKKEAEVLYASVNSKPPHSRGKHHPQRQQESETDYTEVAPQQRGRPSSSLTTEQITVMLLKNPQVQAYAEEVIHWGNVVYGNDKLFQQHLQGILTDSSKGKDLSYEIAAKPESIHKLAGHNALGIKSSARKEAENGFPHLVDAIDGYTKAVEKVKEQLLRTPMAEQRRQQEHSPQDARPHHHHRHHHERGQKPDSPEHSPQRQRHEHNKGFSYAI
ncbi:BID domain-containing T4SS effector [Bartonella rattimassiliensis]|uniref:Bartonella effector protein BID domain-containing protein n=1 Tax=Bartonella rattimassiliensis 15908 TaxID=1094556 RepID=J1JJY7_9HYPH|nr:BID domain-containing T4SS effector [Bartonella rattimassiliensis]EJF84957.1 hypothetical protein MCY_01340 [Bartonella rattimassiliensis 15908]